MKPLILFLSIFIISLNTNAQSERAKKKFVRNVFNDFKSNQLEYISDNFVDSIYIEKLLKKMLADEPKASKYLKTSKIQDERRKARRKLERSLNYAYTKFDNAADGEPGWASLIDIEFKEQTKTPIALFKAICNIELDNGIQARLEIPEMVYDDERGLFFVLSNKVRFKVKDENYYINRRREEAREATTAAAADATTEAASDAAAEAVEAAVEAVEAEIEEAEVEIEEADLEIEEAEVEIKEVVVPPPPPLRRVKKGEAYQFVEQMPEFPGGMKKMQEYLANNIAYPRIAREANIQGRVFIQFVVSKDGTLRDYKVLRGIGGGCEQEAIRVLKRMPKWKPGRQNGKAVAVMFNLPVMFSIE